MKYAFFVFPSSFQTAFPPQSLRKSCGKKAEHLKTA